MTTISLRSESLQWSCQSGYQAFFDRTKHPDFAHLENDSLACLVKNNPLRSVYRVRLDQGDWFVKQFHTHNFTDACKSFWRTNPARREFEHLSIAYLRNIPVPQPIAWASGRGFSLLVTEALTPSQSLESIIYQASIDEALLKQALIAGAEGIATMHCNGFMHTDLHSGNILLVGPAEQPWAGYLTDLQDVRIEQRSGHASANPYQKHRLKNVASIMSGLRYKINPDQQYLFIESYLNRLNLLKNWSQGQIGHYFDTVQKHADTHSRRIWRSKDRRTRRQSKYAQKIKLGNGWTARVFLQCKHPSPDAPASQNAYTPQAWRQALVDPMKLLQQGRLLKEGGHSTIVADKLDVGGENLDIVVKHIRLRENWRGFLQKVRPSRAERQWLRGHGLIHRHLPTAWPLAALEQRTWGLLEQSILICEQVRDSHNLHDLIQDGHLVESPKLRSMLAVQLGVLLADLRQKNCRFRDCKAQNILVVQQPDSRPPFRLSIIDLDGLYLNQLLISLSRHEAIIRLAISMLWHPQITVRYYVRAFRTYVNFLAGPESKDRLLRHQLWRTLQEQVLAKREQKNQS